MVDLDEEIAKLNTEALESSRRMANELETINEEGVLTLTALDEQDEQLDKIEQGLFIVNNDLHLISEDIEKIQSSCFPWKKIMCFPMKLFRKNKKEDIREEVVQSFRQSKQRPSTSDFEVKFRSSRQKETTGEFMKRLTSDTVELEIEKNLIQVDQTLESIKNLAIDINVQLKIQESKIDRIESLAENNDICVEGVNEKVKKLLK